MINIETLQMCCTSKLHLLVVSGDVLFIQLVFFLKLFIILHIVKK